MTYEDGKPINRDAVAEEMGITPDEVDVHFRPEERQGPDDVRKGVLWERKNRESDNREGKE